MLERIIFNILAFYLFIYIFFKMIRKNDTVYIVVLILQAMGISIGFIELVKNAYYGILPRIITYLFSIILPIIIIFIEKKGYNFSEYIYMGIAKVCEFTNNKKTAKRLLLNLVNKYPDSYYGHKLLAEIYEKEGGLRKSIDEYVKVIDINKKDYNSYYKIAVLLNDFNKKEEAIEMLSNLVNKKPEFYKASELLGMLLCDKENFKEAVNVYMNALKYNPNNYEIYYNLGIAYTRLNDFQNAKICYEKAAEINAILYNSKYCLGMIALLYNDIDEAEKYFNETVKSEDVEASSFYHLSRIAVLKGQREKAINYLNTAIQMEPKFAQRALEDPVFIPIQRYIHIPQNIEEKIEEKKTKLKIREKRAIDHLEKTYYLVGKISKNDIKNIKVIDEKNRFNEREKE